MGPDRDELGRSVRWLSQHTPSPQVQQAHLQALLAGVSARPDVAPSAASATSPWRRRVALGTAWGMLAFPGAALAAEGTDPGDLLYPVKRAVEPIRSLFDASIRARHRVDELARLQAEGAPSDRLARAGEDARRAVDEQGDDEQRARLDQLQPPVLDDEVDDEPSTQPSSRATEDESEDTPDDEPSTVATDEDTEDTPDDAPSTQPSSRATADDDSEDTPDDEPTDDPSARASEVDEDTPDDEPTDGPAVRIRLDEDSPDAED